MVEDGMVSGDGWVSDESSFYGDEDEQEHQLDLCDAFSPRAYWRASLKDLNVVVATAKIPQQRKDQQSRKTASFDNAMSPKDTAMTAPRKDSVQLSGLSGLDRKAMEQERLARQGKRKRDASPEPQRKKAIEPSLPEHELFNPREGCLDSWQLGESVDDFVSRVPPLTTSVYTCDWIWVANPHRNRRERSASSREAGFISGGTELLEQSLDRRGEIQTRNVHGPKALLTRQLSEESQALQERVVALAVDNNVLSGKWMLFPKSEDVTRVWKLVVEAVINDRLGDMAKVAPDDGKDERLICVYTKDFRDEQDVSRVLEVLDTMGLVSGRSIYYKSDAYTYLNIYSATAAKFGLQASLYHSGKMMAAGKLAKVPEKPKKKQSTLNQSF